MLLDCQVKSNESGEALVPQQCHFASLSKGGKILGFLVTCCIRQSLN